LPVLGLAFLEIQTVLPVFSFPARPCAIMLKVEQCRLTRSEGEADVRRLNTLCQLLAALSHAGTLEEVYRVAITSLLEATEADRAAILLFDDDGVVRFKSSRGPHESRRRLRGIHHGRKGP
jgi:hypothetical protein